MKKTIITILAILPIIVSAQFSNQIYDLSLQERYSDLHNRGLITNAEYTVLSKHLNTEIHTSQYSNNSLVNKYFIDQGYVSTMGIGSTLLGHLKTFGTWLLKQSLGLNQDCCPEAKDCTFTKNEIEKMLVELEKN